MAAGDDGVGVVVEGEKRRGMTGHVHHVAGEQHPALWGDLVRDEEVEVTQAQRQGEARDEAPNGHAALALVVHFDGLTGVGPAVHLVVELGLLGVGHDPTRVVDTEVDARPGQ